MDKIEDAVSNVVLLIPSFNPNERTIKYIDQLIGLRFEHIIVINDGSKNECNQYFKKIEQRKECIVLKHSVNLGKGRALKTGFNYFLNSFDSDDFVGVVTADADGQHSAKDTLKVAIKLSENKKSLILGTRNFNEDSVPFKSRSGNKITTVFFKILYSKQINDTQTGLRGVPSEFIKLCMSIPGERFEYEIGMLISAVKNKITILEEEIETIYFESNRETNFKPIKDSIRIYMIMFKYFFSFTVVGLLSFFIDITFFYLFYNLVFSGLTPTSIIFWSTLIARIISSLFNYTANKNIVFNNTGRMTSTIVRYYSLSIIQMISSWFLVSLLFNYLGLETTLIKIFVDLTLFFISYQIQRIWVFSEGDQ